MGIAKTEYLNRIGLSDISEPDIQTLTLLQKAHLLAVPFENLDIHSTCPIRLDIKSIFEKVVKRRRGGFCYELNGLFYDLLISLGFQAKRISARVFDADKGAYGAEFDHMAILVKLNGINYLTDVGFGEFAFAPLALQEDVLQEDERGQFRLDKTEEAYWRICKASAEGYANEYIFTEKERGFDEFSGMCSYHQTSPDSHFTQKQLISRPTPTGRITLTSTQLKITDKETEQCQELKDEAAFNAYLKQYFGMTI